jgi:hypothetical protein
MDLMMKGIDDGNYGGECGNKDAATILQCGGQTPQ